MTAAASSAHPALAIIGDAVIPVMAASAVLLPALAWRAGRLKSPRLLWACSLLSIALLYLIRFESRTTLIWTTTFGARFSTHTALAVSLGVTLIAFRLALTPVVVAITAFYLWLIIELHYHTSGDVMSTLPTMLVLSIVCHIPRLLQQRSEKNHP